MNNNDFSKRSRRAIIIFLVLLFVLAIIPRIIIHYTPEKPIHFSWKEKEIIKNFKSIKAEGFKTKYARKIYNTPAKKFDPNNRTEYDQTVSFLMLLVCLMEPIPVKIKREPLVKSYKPSLS